MNRSYLIVVPIALVAVVAALVALSALPTAPTDTPTSNQTYPAGAGPDDINFSALDSDDRNVSHTPRSYWDSYAIVYTAPDDRPIVEGDYYINATTGEILADRWDDVSVYRNGTIYAFFQPAESVPTEREREELDADDAYSYDNATDAYYRYDPQYGQIAPTNIGRHTDLLESYTWEANNRTSHHGVPVITYRVTGAGTDTVPPATNGTLQLGVEDGIVYAFDITLDTGDQKYHYAYDVRPAPFPEHEWVDRARTLAATNTTDRGSSGG